MRVRKKKKNWVWSELNIHHQTEWATERKCPTSHLRQPCPIQRCICVFNEQGIGVLLSLFPTHSRFISSLTDSLSCFLFFPSFTCFPLPVCSSSKKKKKKATASYLCVYLKGGWGGPKALFQVESKSFDMLQYQFHAQFIYSLGTLIVNYFQIRCIFFCHIILLECWYPSSAKFRDLKLQAL